MFSTYVWIIQCTMQLFYCSRASDRRASYLWSGYVLYYRYNIILRPLASSFLSILCRGILWFSQDYMTTTHALTATSKLNAFLFENVTWFAIILRKKKRINCLLFHCDEQYLRIVYKWSRVQVDEIEKCWRDGTCFN